MAQEKVKVNVNLRKDYFDKLNNFKETAARGGHTIDMQQVFDQAFNDVMFQVIRQVDASIAHYLKTGKVVNGSCVAYNSNN